MRVTHRERDTYPNCRGYTKPAEYDPEFPLVPASIDYFLHRHKVKYEPSQG